WAVPKERTKRYKAHNVYLPEKAIDILVALKTCAGNSRYLLPSRYDADAPMSRATVNRVTYAVVERATTEGLQLDPFTGRDRRRQFQVPAALALRCGGADVACDVQSRDLCGRREGQKGGTASGPVYCPWPAPHGFDAAQRVGLQQRLD